MNCKFNSDNKLKRILVTGGAGFIGSALIRRLIIETNTEVFNIDKLTYSSNTFHNLNLSKKSYKFLKIDINNKSKINKVIRRAEIPTESPATDKTPATRVKLPF